MTTEELRAAAERLNNCRDRQIPWEHPQYARTDGLSPACKWHRDLWTYYKSTVDQLEADDQQAADGTLPVEEEWLCDNLHKVCEYTLPWSGETVAVFSLRNGYSIRRYTRDDNTCYYSIWNDKGDEGVRWVDSPTRQQVLDLMRALGATSEPHTTTPSRR